ncbi:MFS transporter [Acrocarpospora pleiomorpha]|uniref:MFS transporter n=1 Tax=Acrocarpospora pleiomorpha TaxID=90975 RepID=A0A5M3XQC4_9ACTN|nr:MFS transporter [Acrocarpospora pleiomorpha]GES21851.1 MFS transporter [Acrocarpospora pleiomorpha]
MLQTIPLRRQRDYRLLWGARAVTEVGSEVSRLAVPLTAVILLGASPLQMGLLTAAASLPFLLVGLPVGAIADRIARRRPVMVGCEVVAGSAVLTVPIAWVAGWLTVPWLIAVALIVGTCTVVFRNFNTPHLTSVVPEHQRTAALAGFQSVFAVAQLGGPGLAGLLVGVLTAPLALIVDAISFLVSAVCLRSIRAPEPTPQTLHDQSGRSQSDPDQSDPDQSGHEQVQPDRPSGHATRGRRTLVREIRRTLVREIGEGIRTLVGHPVLRALTLAGMTVNLFGAAQLAVYVIYAVNVLGLPGWLVGISVVGFGAGGLLGAVVAPRLERRFGGNRVLLGSVLFFPVGFVTMAALSGPVWLVSSLIAVSEVVVGVAVVCFSVCSGAATLREAPEAYIGRVNASINFATQGVMALGGLLGGVLGEFLGLRPAMWVCAAGAVLTIPCLWWSPLTKRAHVPHAEAADSPSTAPHPRSIPEAGQK